MRFLRILGTVRIDFQTTTSLSRRNAQISFSAPEGGGERQVSWDGAGGQDEGGTSHVHGEHPRRAEGAGGRSQTEDSRRHTEPDLIAPRRRRPGPADVTGAARWRPRYVRPRSPLPGAAAPPPRLRERRQRPRRGKQRRPLRPTPRTQPGTAGGTGTRRRGPYARRCREQCWPAEAEVTELG